MRNVIRWKWALVVWGMLTLSSHANLLIDSHTDNNENHFLYSMVDSGWQSKAHWQEAPGGGLQVVGADNWGVAQVVSVSTNIGSELVFGFDWTPGPAATNASLALTYELVGIKVTNTAPDGADIIFPGMNWFNTKVETDIASGERTVVVDFLAGNFPVVSASTGEASVSARQAISSSGETVSVLITNSVAVGSYTDLSDYDYIGIRFGIDSNDDPTVVGATIKNIRWGDPESWGGEVPPVTARQSLMDYFLPMEPQGPLVSSGIWGSAATALPRDINNGLEDSDMSDWCYWDGSIVKSDDGRYHMFASRWSQTNSHSSGWKINSKGMHAVSDNVNGPYVDQGMTWPNWQEGIGHNVIGLRMHDGRYAMVSSEITPGDVFVSDSPDGPFEHLGQIEWDANGFKPGLARYNKAPNHMSNVMIMLRPDGRYQIVARSCAILISDDGILGPYKIVAGRAYGDIPGLPQENMEDPTVWYSGGLYHIVVNHWPTDTSYHLTSEDGIHDWVNRGIAYQHGKGIFRYPDGTVNEWETVQRPTAYVEDGHLSHFNFSVIDVQKGADVGNDNHGSKIIVVPVDGEAFERDLALKIKTEAASTVSINPVADSYVRGGEYATDNYGTSNRLVCANNDRWRPDHRDTRITYLKFDLSSLPERSFTNALFRMRVAGSSGYSDLHTVYFVEDDNWEEATVTWDTRSATNEVLGSMVYPPQRSRLQVDVTDRLLQELQGDKVLTLAVASDAGDRVEYYSREATDPKDRPELALRMELTGWEHYVVDYGLSGSVTADFDADGQTDVEEYAFGGDPTNSTVQAPAPRLTFGTNDSISFYTRQVNAANPGIMYVVEWADNLISNDWNDTWNYSANIPVTTDYNDIERQIYGKTNRHLFVRLKTVQP
ncbi:DUF7594 domain-containing protein [Pontiella agarivorans]|uniref:DNRLRE domain-containing protein n=1 Tax=Pontiella agarivorans TaxID=3038953 RepID=A0ABU5N0N7_9BACT|nr:DNRLRE domain-containing protein [Pontiella agarivorans]MDZ8120007.1 DNRLRE domain-containing protein [Pontiella agarivorans]